MAGPSGERVAAGVASPAARGSDRPLAMVLGGTDDHTRLVEVLKERGFLVALIDPHGDPPAARLSDLHIRADAFDSRDLIDRAGLLGAELVLSLCIDYGFRTACVVSDRLGLPSPLRDPSIDRLFDKALMKSSLRDNGIPAARFARVDRGVHADEASLGLRPPFVVKPVDGHGSRGVSHVRRRSGLSSAVRFAEVQSRSGAVIIEEHIKGDEISLDCVIIDGKPEVVMWSLLRRAEVTSNQQLVVGASRTAPISDHYHGDLMHWIGRIVQLFELPDGPLLIQAFLTADGPVIGEVAPRVGGGSKWRDVAWSSGLDLIEIGVASWLGEALVTGSSEAHRSFIRCHLYTRPGIIGSYRTDPSEMASQGISDFRIYRAAGQSAGSATASSDRAASFRVELRSGDDPDVRARAAARSVDIVASDGTSMVRWDIVDKQWF